ncbi:MAG: carboxymuconolactone decarboxylase family protein [Actinomycetota bacterium]
MSTHAERRRDALDVLRTLTGSDVPEREVDAIEQRHGALGTFAMDHVLGNLWARPHLSRRDRSLVVVTALSATPGTKRELATHTEAGLNHGLRRPEILELVLQVAAYAGFPVAFQATRVVERTFARLDRSSAPAARTGAPPIDDADRWVAAARTLAGMTGGQLPIDPLQARSAMIDEQGGVGEVTFDFVLGELWARTALNRRDRSMATVTVLAMLREHDELAEHIKAARHHGCTRSELEEVMVQLTAYGGLARATGGMRVARRVWTELDAADG